jgi:DNA repair protein RadC
LKDKSQNKSSSGHRQRLKDRWQKVGLQGFEDHEILELLLSFGLPRVDTKPLAKDIIHASGSLKGVWNQSVERLMGFEGMGQHSAILVHLVGQLMNKPNQKLKGIKLKSPSDVGDYFLRTLGSAPEEHMYLVLLDQKNAVIEVVECEHGIENRAQIYTKRILRNCLDHFATGVILIHNHPSGQPEFSSQDIAFTKHIKQALTAVEIRLLDHLLITPEVTVSMQEENLL